jgi:hypothetical protein
VRFLRRCLRGWLVTVYVDGWDATGVVVTLCIICGMVGLFTAILLPMWLAERRGVNDA